MTITIENQLLLELVDPRHAQELFNVADANRDHIKTWMPWIVNMQSVDFIKGFINGALERYNSKSEYAYVITHNGAIIGRIGLYKIDNMNKIAEIGYWIAKDYEGQGFVTKAANALVKYAFETLQFNRIEIRCGFNNIKSQSIPERLHFTYEGLLREAELLHGQFQDLKLYAMLRSDYNG
jgi:ribosomal-protein-serine acetyltransferase